MEQDFPELLEHPQWQEYLLELINKRQKIVREILNLDEDNPQVLWAKFYKLIAKMRALEAMVIKPRRESSADATAFNEALDKYDIRDASKAFSPKGFS